MSTLIVPCAGQSSRYPNMRPKYLLTHPNGNAMVTQSLRGIDLKNIDQIYIGVLREHYDKYKFGSRLMRQLEKKLDTIKVKYSILDKPTLSQPETVVKIIEQENIQDQIHIKDCDNYFECMPQNGNNVTVVSLNDLLSVNPSNKSYVQVNDVGQVVNIIEKRVISDKFCCGLYSIDNAKRFCKDYYRILSNTNPKEHSNIYLSTILHYMLYGGYIVNTIEVQNYKDWGTLDDWLQYKKQFQTIFVDLDGILVENSGEYLEPYWGTTKGIQANIDYINALYDQGNQIIITTSRTREFEKETLEQIERCGIKADRILFQTCPRRTIINDFAPSNPYPSCEAINIPRNSML